MRRNPFGRTYQADDRPAEPLIRMLHQRLERRGTQSETGPDAARERPPLMETAHALANMWLDDINGY